MNILFERISDLSTGRVDFYTVYIEDSELSEFEQFVEKDFGNNHSEELETVYKTIDAMGKRGALHRYFRPEGRAHALPGNDIPIEIVTANQTDYGIRLYCIRLREDLVILLNGDIKTTLKVSDCQNVNRHFANAQRIAYVIDKALEDKEIDLDDLENYEP